MGFMKFVRAQWDRAGAVAFALIGLLSLLLGWIGTSGTEHVAKQLPYIVSGALTGIFFLGLATTLWISADLRDEWRELRSIGGQLRDERAERRLERAAVVEAPTAVNATPARPRRTAARSGS
jgi:hypothetical protein